MPQTLNFSASAALQARSIFALILRRIRSRYQGSRAGYAWAVVEPLVWVLVLKMIIRHGNNNNMPPVGDSYEVFLGTGIVVAKTWRTSATAILPFVTRSRKRLLPTLHQLDALYAAWILEVITGAIVMIVMLLILSIFGFNATPGNLLACVIAFLGMALLGLSSGLFLGLIMVMMPGLSHFRNILLMGIFITSGFAFVVDRMAPEARALLVWNPVLHCVEWFREAFYVGYECRSLDLVYLFAVTIILMVIGLASERALRRKKPASATTYEQDEDAF